VHYQTHKKIPKIRTDCTTPLCYVLAATCFGSSLPSSGSFLDPSELLGRHNRPNHDNPAHMPRNHTLFDRIPPIQFVFQVTQKDLRSSLMMAGYCRNMQEQVHRISGFGGLVVSMLASGTQGRWFIPVGFFGRKNSQHAFLRRGSKAVCPMSQLCGV
jgi:hypothetical protein